MAKPDETPASDEAMTNEVLVLVAAERRRQREKWGTDDLPTVEPKCVSQRVPLIDYYDQPPVDVALLRSICDIRARVGRVTMADVLNEEVAETYEAVVEHGDDSEEAEAEAVQVAAVAVRIAESIIRRRRAKAAVEQEADGGPAQ